jgi:hypothetical protein
MLALPDRQDGDVAMSLEQLRALLHAPFDLEHGFEAALSHAAHEDVIARMRERLQAAINRIGEDEADA